MMNMMLAPAAFLVLLLLLLVVTPLGALCVTCLHVAAQGAAALSMGGVGLGLAAQASPLGLGSLPGLRLWSAAPVLRSEVRRS